MKKSIIVTLVVTTCITAIITASCSVSVPVAGINPTKATTPAAPPRISNIQVITDDPQNDREVFARMQESTIAIINTYKFMNQPVPEKLVAAQQSNGEASIALQKLGEDWQETTKCINQYKFLVQPVPGHLTTHLQSIEDQRQVILIRCGLVD
jgi:hypothetical protein